MRPSILLVEDDPVTRKLLHSTLVGAGFDLHMAENGAGMWRLLKLHPRPDAVILDLCLPDTDGLDLLRQLRQTSDVPVLIHSMRSDEIERITGIEIGADDFLPKPCNLRELLARLRALLRRSRTRPGVAPVETHRWVRFAGWTLDTGRRSLLDPTGQSVELGGSAYALLSTFLEHAQAPLSREYLSRVLGRDYLPYDRSVDVHVSQLRKLLGTPPDGGVFIKTLRSKGYVFVLATESADAE